MSLRARIEAVIYAAEEPVTLAQLSALFGAEAVAEQAGQAQVDESPDPPAGSDLFASEADAAGQSSAAEPEQQRLTRRRDREAREAIRRLLDELTAEYDSGERGVEIRQIAGGYRIATRPEYHDAVRSFVKSLKPPMKLSLQALETLAVIAYKQPVTAPEVSEIRGVDSGGVLGSLISRKLVTTAGRKQVIGRPILYKTTKEFLLRFGLKDLAELPSMEEFEKMAGELAEAEAEAEPASQLALAATQTIAETSQGEPPMPAVEPLEASPFEAAPPAVSDAAEVHDAQVQIVPNHAAPATEPASAEELEDEELRANARANVQVDDESSIFGDLPGVTRDTAGRLDIDSRKHSHSLYREDEY